MATSAPPIRPKRTSAKTPPPSKASDPVARYAHDVTSGRILAGPMVRLACARHLRDLTRSDLVFDKAKALRAIGFFRDVLRLNGGDFEGKPFILSDWQAFIVGSLFGWLSLDGYRRFRVAYIEAPKGSGKSPLAAGVGHLMLSADGEARAEVYAAATKKDQAMILFRDAVAMWQQSPALTSRLKASGQQPNIWNLADLTTGSFFRPISSDDGQSGPRPHCGLIDELHEHKSPMVTDMMRAGTKGRTQALIFEITNSGYDRHSVCWQHHEYSGKVLEQIINDDSWFAYVCGLDPQDDWTDEKVWGKANPNLGVSVPLKYLREQVREAQGMAAKQNTVRRLNFCAWTEQDERWLDMALWDTGAEPIDAVALRGRPCYGGLDLARTRDLSAFALLFPPLAAGETWKVLMRFWIPDADMRVRSQRDRVPYDVWVREGLISCTQGNATDFSFIEKAIVAACGEYDVREVAYDRVFAGEIVQNLMAEGVTMVPFGQGFISQAAPVAELHRMLLAGEFQHGGNPVLRWNASNVTVAQDPAGNLKLDKARSTERIDGIAALCNAIGRAQVHPVEGASVYETRGIISL